MGTIWRFYICKSTIPMFNSFPISNGLQTLGKVQFVTLRAHQRIAIQINT